MNLVALFTILGNLSQLSGLKTIAMTTNGVTLSRKVADLKAAGLTSVNISLDTMVPQKFEFISRRKGLLYLPKYYLA